MSYISIYDISANKQLMKSLGVIGPLVNCLQILKP